MLNKLVMNWRLLMVVMLVCAAVNTYAGEHGLMPQRLSLVLSLISLVAAIMLPVMFIGKPMPGEAKKVRGPMLAKVNDPCPCGSGKKYKKCCMER